MANNRIQNVLGSMSKLLECAICLDLMKNPVVTRCNHNFCRFCITEFLKNKKSVPCPLCKEAVTKRSLLEQDKLNAIVSNVSSLINAYQEDTGELFSPPRGSEGGAAFFPCTPEPILSQTAPPPPANRRQAKRNLKRSKKPEATTTQPNNINHGHEITNQDRAETNEPSMPRNTRRRTTSGNIRHGSRTSTRTRADQDSEREKALLMYLNEGSCGRNSVSEHGDASNAEGNPEVDDDSERPSQNKHVAKLHSDQVDILEIGPESQVMKRLRGGSNDGDGIDVGSDTGTENIESTRCHPSRCGHVIVKTYNDDDMDVDIDEASVDENVMGNSLNHVNDNLASVQHVQGRVNGKGQASRQVLCKSSVTPISSEDSHSHRGITSPGKGLLELTPEVEYEQDEEYEACDHGNDHLLFQSQEVKEIRPKVKLNLYTGKKMARQNSGKQVVNETNDNIVSSSETPVLMKRDFQNDGQVRTYSRSRSEKNKKKTMIKQWVEQTQLATENHAFSDSDSRLLNSNTEKDQDDFGFGALLDEPVETRDNSKCDVAPVNKKKLFRSKEKEKHEEENVVKETDLPSSDPYEFKSSGTLIGNDNTKGKGRSKGKKGKGKAAKAGTGSSEVEVKTNKTRAKQRRESGISEAVEEVSEEKDQKKKEKGKEQNGEKHVRFNLKSPEQEMSSLIDKIGEAEDHDFLFSTQEALSTMTEEDEEEEEDVLLMDDSNFQTKNLDACENGDIKIDASNVQTSTCRTDVETRKTDNIVENSEVIDSEKSQSLTIVPPTPMLPMMKPFSNIASKSKPTHQQKQTVETGEKVNHKIAAPIPPRKKNKGEILETSSQRSDKSVISPTPMNKPLNESETQKEPLITEAKLNDEGKSEDSSSTEDLDITLDETQIEVPDLDIQPEEVKRQLSQESLSGSRMSRKSHQSQNHNQDIELIEDHKPESRIVKNTDLPEQMYNDDLSVIADTAESQESLSVLKTRSGDKSQQDRKIRNTADARTSQLSDGPSIDAIADTVDDDLASQTRTREIDHKNTAKKTDDQNIIEIDNSTENQLRGVKSQEPSPDAEDDNIECSLRSRIKKKLNKGKKNKINPKKKPKQDVVEICDSEDEQKEIETDKNISGNNQPKKVDADEKVNIEEAINSQASTISASLQHVQNVQDLPTLPPDDSVEDDDQEREDGVAETAEASKENVAATLETVQESMTEEETAVEEIPSKGDVDEVEASTAETEACPSVPEASVSVLESHLDEDNDSDVQVISGKSKEPSTVESVSILQNDENVDSSAPRRSRRQKRKFEEDESVTPILPKSVPTVSSAPITVHLDDSDDEMLVVRRPKRKCFSLDGSPLKARSGIARAKLSRRAKPSPRDSLQAEKLEEEPMDVGDATKNNDVEDIQAGLDKCQETPIPEKETEDDLQPIGTVPEFTCPPESMEDIFNKNSDCDDSAEEDDNNTVCNELSPKRSPIAENHLDKGPDEIDESSEESGSEDTKRTPTIKKEKRKGRRSKVQDSDSSESEEVSSVRKGVRAVRGLANRKSVNSPIVSSSKSLKSSNGGENHTEDPAMTNKTTKLTPKSKSKEKLQATPKSEHSKLKTCERTQSVCSDSDEPSVIQLSHTGKHKEETITSETTRQRAGRNRRKPSDSNSIATSGRSKSVCSDTDEPSVIQLSCSELTGKSQKSQYANSKTKNITENCHVGISPTDIIDVDLAPTPNNISQEKTRASEQAPAGKVTEYSSSDEEFVLRDDDEIIRKAEAPILSDVYSAMPQTSSPIAPSCPKRDETDESDIEQQVVKKSSRCPIISDSDSDSCHSDQQMNFTSSSAFSSQSEVLTTQQQGRLEKDMEAMRQEIQQLEALSRKANSTTEALSEATDDNKVVECSKDTPDVISPSNKTKVEDSDSSSDGELFLSPLSPSPPPNTLVSTTTTSLDDVEHKMNKKERKVIEAFKMLDKYKSPDLSRSSESGSSALQTNTSIKSDKSSSKYSPALRKRGETALEDTIENVAESDLPLLTSPIARVKKEKFVQEASPLGRKVLSPLTFENRKKSPKPIVLITSGLGRDQMLCVHEFVGKTGSMFFPKFNKNVTHLIVRKAADEDGQICDRTLKYFQGIVGKCWILSYDWIMDSLQAGKPVSEVKYEMTGDTVSGEHHFGPKRSRTSEKKLFSGFAFACIGVSSEMSKEDMMALVELGGGTVAEDAWELGNVKSSVKLIVRCLDYEERPNQSEIETFNNFYKHFRLVTVSREWVLDSISSFRVQSLKEDYVLTTVNNPVLPF